MDEASIEPLAWGPFVLRPETRQFLRSGEPVDLQPLAWRLLEHLARHRGRAVSREQLTALLWPDTHVVGNALAQVVRRVRAALDDEEQRRLVSVPRFGYRLVDEPRADPGPALVGRAEAVSRIRALLRTEGAAVVTGLGGVGKTTVARAVAEAWPQRWRIALGRWRAPGGPTASDELLAHLAAHLGAAGPAAVAPALRAAGDPLLVLDEAEGAPEAVAAVVGRLRPVTRILVTSRVPVEGLPTFALGPLPAADARALFLRNAAPTAASQEGLERVLARLDGFPLALVLAARRTRAMTVSDLDRLLARPFSTLADAGETGRQRAMAAVLDGTWRASTDAERRAWSLLSAWPAGATLAELADAAAEVGDPDFLPDALATLVDAGIVSFREDAGGRYALLALVRQWGADRLADDPARARAVRDAMAGALARRGDPEAMRTFRGRDGPALLRWAVDERPNLEAASAHAESVGAGATAAALALLLMHVAELHGPVLAGAERLARARALPGAEARERELLSAEAGLRRYVGRRDEALDLSLRARAVAERGGDPIGLANARANLGSLFLELGRIPEGVALLREALEVQEKRDPAGAGATECALGRAAELAGDTAGAEAAWRAADLRLRVHGSPRLEAINLALLGRLLARTGRAPEGLRALRRALAGHRAVGDTISEGWTLGALGAVAADQGLDAEALDATAEQLAVARATGQRRLEAVALDARGELWLSRGALDRAEEDLVAADALHADAGADRSRLVTTTLLARVAAATGDRARAFALLDAVEAQARALGAVDRLDLAALERVEADPGAPGARAALDARVPSLEARGDCGALARLFALRARITGDPADLERARAWSDRQGGGPGSPHRRAVAFAEQALQRG